MKPSYYVVVIFLAAVFSLSSCSKEELTTQGGGNITNQTFSPYTLDLTAANWSQVASGVYTCPIPGVIPPGHENTEIKIYLLLPDKKIQINTPIDFMGGQLSAAASGPHISVNYLRSDNHPLPFSYLNIRAVIE